MNVPQTAPQRTSQTNHSPLKDNNNNGSLNKTTNDSSNIPTSNLIDVPLPKDVHCYYIKHNLIVGNTQNGKVLITSFHTDNQKH